jgi:hypothetical protein
MILKLPPHRLEDVLTPLDCALLLASLLPLHQLGLDPVGEAQDCPDENSRTTGMEKENQFENDIEPILSKTYSDHVEISSKIPV